MQCPLCDADMNLEEVDFAVRPDESDLKDAWVCPECNEIELDIRNEDDGGQDE